MDNFIINIDKFKENIKSLPDINIDSSTKKFEKFIFNFFSSNDILERSDIENLDLDFVQRLSDLLEAMTFNLIDYKDWDDYKSLVEIYRFNSVNTNISNISKVPARQTPSPTLMYY